MSEARATHLCAPAVHSAPSAFMPFRSDARPYSEPTGHHDEAER